MAKTVTIVVEVVLFTALIGIVFDALATPSGNMSGASLIMYGLIGLIVVVGFIVGLLKQQGLYKA